MPFHQPDQIRYYTFDIMESEGVRQAVYTRRGGVSPVPWAALNLGGTVGDDPQRVRENRSRAFQVIGCSMESMYDVWQVHSSEVVCTDRPRPPDARHLQADAILTDTPGVTLFMRFADCVPIMLFDPQKKVVGLVHAGWKGTVDQIVRIAVQTMELKYHTRPEDIRAGVGPSIGAHHYEIGPEVAARVHAAYGQDAGVLLSTHNGSSVHFDLWEANRLLLERAGVQHIQVAGICTACHLDDWYSHRGEKGKTGRFGVVIGL